MRLALLLCAACYLAWRWLRRHWWIDLSYRKLGRTRSVLLMVHGNPYAQLSATDGASSWSALNAAARRRIAAWGCVHDSRRV